MNQNRFDELDSVRGLAALSVVIHHCLLVFVVFLAAHQHSNVDNGLIQLLSNSPLHIFWAGHEAVMLFFVLSGFVLSLSFLNKKKQSYGAYLTKRFCRIYIPYIITIMISASLLALIGINHFSDLSSWFNGMWSRPVTLDAIPHILMMTGYGTHNLNTVTWSLVHEMRISIIFPIIIFFIIKYKWNKTLIFGTIIPVYLWIFLKNYSVNIENEMMRFYVSSLSHTIYYAMFFIIGALLAKYRQPIINKMSALSRKTKGILLCLSIFLYTIEWNIPIFGEIKRYGTSQEKTFNTLIIDLFITAGVILLFSIILSSATFKSFLNKKPFLFLGRISYSLYLIHPIVLLVYVNSVSETLMSPIWLVVLVPLLSIVVAALMYKYIEKPSIRLGRKLTSKTYNTTSYSEASSKVS